MSAKTRPEMLDFLLNYLEKLGYTVTHAAGGTFENPPAIEGYYPDAVGSLRGKATVYGVALLPEEVEEWEAWERVKVLSADPKVPLYIAFPEEEKQKLIIYFINGKLMERPNIKKIYL